MLLYEVPNKTWIRATEDATVPPCAPAIKKDDMVFFDHLDGMYSFCQDEEGNVVHLHCGSEVEIVEGK